MAGQVVSCGVLKPLAHLWNRYVTSPASSVANAARVAVVGLTMQVHLKAANLWRDLHNPLRGLTMSRAVSYLEEGERGAYADLQWLFRYIEKRDATLRGGKRSLLSAVSEMDWDIKPVAKEKLPVGYTEQQAAAQVITLRTAYDAISNLTEAIEFLGLAEFRGFAHLEKVAGISGGVSMVTELRPVEQWYWCRDGLTGAWQYNRDARPGRTKGEEIDPSRFIIREIDDPINEIALIAFVRKSLGRKDEDGFIESYGVPSIFAIMPQNVPLGKEAEYQALADQVIGDSRGTLPHGADIKTLDAGARGVAPFRAYQDALDKEIVMAITSGQLTMLAESGSGTLAGGAHSDTFMRVARALAKRITTTLQRQFDLAILAAAHPGQPPLAYFEILTNEETDTSEVVEDVTSLESAGFEVDPGYIEEKTGYPVKRKAVTPGLPVKPGQRFMPNRGTPAREPEREPQDLDADFLADALDLVEEAMQADCTELAQRLQNLLTAEMTDDEFRSGLAQLQADLPGLAAKIAGGEETVKAWEAILAAAMGNELASETEDA